MPKPPRPSRKPPRSSRKPAPGPAFRPVGRKKRAYEQVADQLRELIVSGDLAVGDRLPSEVELGERLGVSRATVREALRVLSAEGLIDTRKGARGGSFVTRLDVASLARTLGTSLVLLRATEDVTAREVTEARLLLQVAAVRAAARRATPEQVEHLRELVAEDGDATAAERLARAAQFQYAVTEASGNRLLALALGPVGAALAAHVSDEPQEADTVDRSNRVILEAIAAGDADAAERAMREHIAGATERYEERWGADAGTA